MRRTLKYASIMKGAAQALLRTNGFMLYELSPSSFAWQVIFLQASYDFSIAP